MNTHNGFVFVVDDDAPVRKSLERLLRGAGYTVETFATAADFFAREAPPDAACALLDLAMPGMSGLEIQARINDDEMNYAIVFLTGHGDLETGVGAMRQGAVDFLTKPVDSDRLITAIDQALARQLEISKRRSRQRDADACFSRLTAREREVMDHVVAGRLNKQIAADLNISEKTVKAHRAQVMRKTGAGSLADLVRMHLASKPGS